MATERSVVKIEQPEMVELHASELAASAAATAANTVAPGMTTVGPGLARFKSVRSKPKSFGGWKDSVKTMCRADDLSDLEEGHSLFKVRKKPLMGITWHKRKYRLKLEDLCITYDEGKKIDLENITEVY